MNYYKRHLGDYAKDTGHLTALEHGVYTLLLDWYYANERAIPDSLTVRIARGNPEETQTVLSEFFQKTDDGWVHNYADRVIAEYNAKADRNRASGLLGGRPKKTQTVSETNPQGTLATSHKPLANKEHVSASGDAPKRQQSIPVDSIVDAYNATMTRLAKVRTLTPKRKRAIESLWRSSPLAGDIELFRQYFDECELDPFLSGVGPYRNGHENWRPDFDYLTRPDVVAKTYERALDAIDREARA